MVWTYDPSASTFDRWPALGNGPPNWGSVSAMRQVYTPESPLVGQASLLIARNLAVVGFAPGLGTVTKLTGALHFWGETEDDYIAMPPLTAGRVRSLFQVRRASGSGRYQVGAACLASTDSSEDTGTAYALILDGAQPSSTWEALKLVYYSGPNGLRSPYVTLAEIPYSGARSTVHGLDLRWTYDAVTHALALQGWLGTQANFSDLTQRLTWTQALAPAPSFVTQHLVLVMDALTLSDGDLALCVDATTMEGTLADV